MGLSSDGDPAPLLPAVLADRYEVGRALGQGGMACVYLARDVKHGRDVAIKVIRPELSASLAHERFLREIEIAARLRHPNIVPLYDSGEADGKLYFVMPYEEGPSLGERLGKEGALPLADGLSILRDVGRALAYAHEHGVVHRDVKPDNVMLSSGAAVVTDFGIAKAVTAALTDTPGSAITRTGSSVGTPAYVAPEQATGDPSTDHRADIYSFGCLAYAVLTGHPPFRGQSTHQVIASHLTTVPPPVSDLRPEVPAAVASLVARCLEKDPRSRPQSAREVLGALESAPAPVSLPAPTRPATPARRPAWLRWAALAAAAGIAGIALLFPRGDGGPPEPAAAAAAPLTLAVLPFFNLNSDSTLAFVADWFYEEVASALSRVPGILVKSRSGARAYRGQLSVDVVEAGAKLKADYLLTGEVRQDRGRWILSATLERQSDAASIWNENFVLEPDQQASAAVLIADSLASSLRARFPATIGAAPALAASQRTASSEAYRLYLRGQERLSRRGQSVKESADLFRWAIAQDSMFAPAWSGLSLALVLFPHFQGASVTAVRDDVVRTARRALELDSTQAQPHIALGLLHQFEHQWDAAARELETAVRLEGRNVEARLQYGRHLLFRGRMADAMSQLRTARAQDPESALVLSYVSYAFLLSGMPDSALIESEHALANDPANLTSIAFGSLVRLRTNRLDQARELARRTSLSTMASYVLTQVGDTAEVRRQFREEEGRLPKPWAYHTRRAHSLLGLGDTAAALTELKLAVDADEIWTSLFMIADPMYDPIRENGRFREILRRVGLGQDGQDGRDGQDGQDDRDGRVREAP